MGLRDRFKKVLGSGEKKDRDFKFQENEISINPKNFKYLDDLIHSGVNEIVLDSDIVLEDGEESEYSKGIELDVDGLVIDGNGHTINACGKTRMFKISAKNVVIKELSFKNGFSFKGGAIYVCQNSSLTIKHCYFKDNSAETGGGVIYNYSPLEIIDCQFNDNSSQKQGGVIYNQASSNINFINCIFCNNSSKNGIYGHGGGVVFENRGFSGSLSTFNFDGCKFIQNSAGGSGGAICLWESEAKLTDCIFNNNSSDSYGGAIYSLGGSLNMENCNFNGNSTWSGGGAIYSSSKLFSSLNKCTFIDNSSGTIGGVVYCERNSALNFNFCDFSKNSSKNEGAVIFNETGDLKFTYCNFNNNNSLKSGGCIYNEDIVSLIDCNFENNCAIEDGGDICNCSMANIHNSIFVNNEHNRNVIFQADNEDNALSIVGSKFTSSNNIIYIENGFVNVNNSKFDIAGDNYGIFSKKAILSIVKSKLNTKKAIFCDYIIELEEKSELEKQIVFGENFKTIRYINSDYPANHKGFKYLDELVLSGLAEIELEYDIKIHEIEKNFYEGGIELDRDLIINGNGHVIDANGLSRVFIITSGDITLKNIIFKNGKHFKNHFLSDMGGGVILSLPLSKLTIEDCQFEGNESRQNAGAIYNKSPDLKISNSNFINNSSQDRGGVILTSGSLILNNCHFCNNSSNWGGVICNTQFLECINSCFKDNSSKVGAGAIYNQNGNFNLKNSSFQANSSRSGEGGAIYNDKGAFLDLFDCKFIENYSKFMDAGAIYNVGEVNCNSGCFDLNNSAHQGGAIGNGGLFNLIDCSFKQNSALFGGAIYNKWNLLKCEDCSFDDDSSKNNGNELYVIQDGSLELNGCKFKNLDIYQDDEAGPLTIADCSFKEGNIRSYGNIRIFENEKGKYEDNIDGNYHVQYMSL